MHDRNIRIFPFPYLQSNITKMCLPQPHPCSRYFLAIQTTLIPPPCQLSYHLYAYTSIYVRINCMTLKGKVV